MYSKNIKSKPFAIPLYPFIIYHLPPRTYEAENHKDIPWTLIGVKDRARMKILPDWLRRALGLPERLNRGHSKRVPQEVEHSLNEVLERIVAGSGRNLQGASSVKMQVLVETARKLHKAWTDAYTKVCKDGPPYFPNLQKPSNQMEDIQNYFVGGFQGYVAGKGIK